ncbi:hypothetical protein [Pedobacter nutrimenti]|uniref:Uncharacterized protein n=1 Tax=Pedobacter nutrimenti TaxID=1241337 RepID=A0A318U609_9SPHI|nr:hypothetical protein [Pedobacter nutrimenti]PYF68475.1 hypothetical protein B0O44_11262 [Pedobacter nutrimenti]
METVFKNQDQIFEAIRKVKKSKPTIKKLLAPLLFLAGINLIAIISADKVGQVFSFYPYIVIAIVVGSLIVMVCSFYQFKKRDILEKFIDACFDEKDSNNVIIDKLTIIARSNKFDNTSQRRLALMLLDEYHKISNP